MYSVPSACAEAVFNDKARYALTGTITLTNNTTITISDSIIDSGSVSITHSAVTGEAFEFGTAIYGELNMTILSDADRYLFYNARLSLSCTITYGTTPTTQVVPMGIWTIQEATRTRDKVKITAYDNVCKLDTDYSVSIEDQPYEYFITLCESCGVECANSEAYFLALPNGDENFSMDTSVGCDTIRQTLAGIAQATGGYVCADRVGKIAHRQFSMTPDSHTLTSSNRYSATIGDFTCSYVALTVETGAGTLGAESELGTGLTMSLQDAPGFQIGVEDTFQRRVDNLFEYLQDISYTPCEISITNNPLIDVGDCFTVIGNSDDDTVTTILTEVTWNYRGSTDLTSTGINPLLNNSSTSASTAKILRKVRQELDSKKFIYYSFTNASKIKLRSDFTTVGTATFVAEEDTQAVFNATFQVDIEVDDTDNAQTFTVLGADGTTKTITVHDYKLGQGKLYIKYFLDEVCVHETYTDTLTAGSHIISLYYPLSNVSSDTVHKWAVSMACDGCTASIGRTMFQGAVAGQGLASSIPWDGTITIEEVLTDNVNIGALPTITVDNVLHTSVTTYLETPKQATASDIAELVQTITLPTLIALSVYDADLNISGTTLSASLDVVFAPYYEYDRDVLTTDAGFSILDTLTFTTSTMTINEGACVGVTISAPTVTIESLEVIEDE